MQVTFLPPRRPNSELIISMQKMQCSHHPHPDVLQPSLCIYIYICLSLIMLQASHAGRKLTIVRGPLPLPRQEETKQRLDQIVICSRCSGQGIVKVHYNFQVKDVNCDECEAEGEIYVIVKLFGDACSSRLHFSPRSATLALHDFISLHVQSC